MCSVNHIPILRLIRGRGSLTLEKEADSTYDKDDATKITCNLQMAFRHFFAEWDDNCTTLASFIKLDCISLSSN